MDERQPLDDIAAAGSPATPDALKAIVARHQRTRTRTLGVLLAVALVAGPLAGWAIGNAGGGGTQVATGSGADRSATRPQSQPQAAGAAYNSSQAIAIAGPNPPKLTHLFTRTAGGGIVIRAYRSDPPPEQSAKTPTTSGSTNTPVAPCPQPMTVKPGAPGPAGQGKGASGSATAVATANSGEAGSSAASDAPPPPGPGTDGGNGSNGAPPPPCPSPPPPCKSSPAVVAEASTDAAVGQSFDPIDEKQPSDALSHLSVAPFGVPESSPAIVVTVQTGPAVSNVRLRLPSGATDQMAPNGGVAVLALPTSVPPPDGTVVEALDADNTVVGSQPITQGGPKMAFACGFAGGPGGLVAPGAPKPATPPTTR